MDDFNVVTLLGKLTAPPEMREFESGSRLIRMLITTRTNEPRRRVDVIPVTLWDPPDWFTTPLWPVASKVWLVGSIQRRFWSENKERKSRIELVAHRIETRNDEVAVAHQVLTREKEGSNAGN